MAALGVSGERTYVDHGLTGTNRERPGLREALAACRAGDTLVVTKLDRLARSLPDAWAVAQTDDALSAANWIADVVDADRDDSLRPTSPPTRLAVSTDSLLHRVVEAERG